MQQFVIEAAVTSSLGGVIGILIGCIATTVVGAAIGISATPTLSAIVISFSVSVGIGLLFGYMPASRAANLNPIDALRSEYMYQIRNPRPKAGRGFFFREYPTVSWQQLTDSSCRYRLSRTECKILHTFYIRLVRILLVFGMLFT